MKRIFFLLGVLFVTKLFAQQVVYNYNITNFNVSIPGLKSGQFGLAGGIANVSGAIMYKVKGIEHIIQNSADSLSPALHFFKDTITNKWVFENYYPEASVTGGFRNYVFVDTLGTIAFASTGSESMQPWPHGDLVLCKTQGTKLKWTRISNEKSFYHSIGMGDLNGDGLIDAVGVHMGTLSGWSEEPHIYTQNADSSFSQTRNFLDVSQYKGMYNGLGSTYVGYLLGNKYPEIVLAEYGFNPSFGKMNLRQGFGVFTYDSNNKKYNYLSSPNKLGAFSDSTHGATSIKSADFNRDGKTDLAIATEGYPAPKIQIWLGNGKGDFSPSQILYYQDTALPFPQSIMDFREFEIMDFNSDGWPDIVVHPYHSGKEFRINPGPLDMKTNPNGWNGSGIKLQSSIWKNTKGVFDTLKNNIILPDIHPDFMKGFLIDNNIKFFGFEMNPGSPPNFNNFKLYDVTVHFCNTTKPTFNTNRSSFVTGDSLRLTISNANKGDTIKWYYGNKSDVSNVISKTFLDSTNLYVTRTDSLGCIMSSDTIKITTYPKLQITTKLRTFKFNLNSYKDAAPNIFQKMHQTICQTVLYSVNGVEHIVTIPVDSTPNAPIHFINKTGNWELEKFYPNFKMDGARNYSFIDTLGNFAYANTGSEVPRPWPLGDLVVVKTLNDTLKWTKVDSVKAFYHSVGTGDINGDGLIDVVGLHMQSDYWGDNLHPFLQNKNGTYSEGRSVISSDVGAHRNSSGAVLVADLLGDSKPEIIRGSYGFTGANGETRYAFEILSYDNQKNQYVKVYEPKNLGVFTDIANGGQGATSIKTADFDHNGFKDLVICSEGNLPNSNTKGASMIQIWLNNGKGEFIPGQYIINNADDSLNIREFEVADIDNDGWSDIVMHGIGGPLYRVSIPTSKYGNYFKINNLIWKNNKGVFDILPNQLNVYDSTNIELIGNSNFLKGFMVNGKLKYVGFESADAINPTKLYEITVNFCNNLIKPTFSNTKFSFCSGDSLKLSISNINKGDTLKWFYGTKSDLTNVSNKTFTDSTKLFVTRTDSLGCVISSDTVNLVKYPIPSAPTLSRDTANNLVASINGITWYKDGTAISDTIQKFKPTTGGSYTAKTTQNGCTSVLSAAYYYLVTDIINLSKDEYIKLAPNPFINQLNFDFEVKGYQRLNIEVYDIATGTKVASQPNLTAGSRITLAQLSGGTYIIRVTSNDQKIVQQFKVVKM